MSNSPLQMSFWTKEQWTHFNALAPWLIEVLFRGAVTGVEALPEGLRVLMNWNVYNQAALDYLDKWRLGTLRDIDDNTRNRAVKIITEWVQSGEPLPLLEKRMGYLFDEPRARRIAVTEVTRMYAEGNQMAWQASGVVSGKRWMTGVDDRVCPLCSPLQDKVVSLDGAWTMDSGDIIEGLGVTGPPLHPACRCYLQPIVDTGAARGNLRKILGMQP